MSWTPQVEKSKMERRGMARGRSRFAPLLGALHDLNEDARTTPEQHPYLRKIYLVALTLVDKEMEEQDPTLKW